MASSFEFNKRTAMSLFIILVFGFSMVGYAFIQNRGPVLNRPENPLDKTYSLNRTLTSGEKVYILRTGRMLIENLYNDTRGQIPELTSFASKHPNYVFVVQTPVNETDIQFRLIGTGGDIKELDPANITESYLFDLLCEFGIRRPVQCTLREM